VVGKAKARSVFVNDQSHPIEPLSPSGIGADTTNHYETLGVSLFESDARGLERAFRERHDSLRKYETGKYQEQVLRQMDRLSEAYHCLTDPERRQAYDAWLRQELQSRRTVADSAADTQTQAVDASADRLDTPAGSKNASADATQRARGSSNRVREAIKIYRRMRPADFRFPTESSQSSSAGERHDPKPVWWRRRSLLAFMAGGVASMLLVAVTCFALVIFVVRSENTASSDWWNQVIQIEQLMERGELTEARRIMERLKQESPDWYAWKESRNLEHSLSAAIAEDEARQIQLNQFIADAQHHAKTLGGYQAALSALASAMDLATGAEEEKMLDDLRVWIENRHQKLKEEHQQNLAERLAALREKHRLVQWSDLKTLETLIEDGEHLMRSSFGLLEHRVQARSLVLELQQWLALARSQPRLQQPYDLDRVPPVSASVTPVARSARDFFPRLADDSSNEDATVFTLTGDLSPGEYAIYVHGLDVLGPTAACYAVGDRVTVTGFNRQDICHFYFSDPRRSKPSQLCCEIVRSSDPSLLELQTRLPLLVLELRGPGEISDWISLTRPRSHRVAMEDAQEDVPLSPYLGELLVENLALGGGHLSYGDRHYRFGTTWREEYPSVTQQVGQLVTDLGLSVAEIQLQVTPSEPPKIIARFEPDHERLQDLDREIQIMKKEWEELTRLIENASAAAERQDFGLDMRMLANALGKEVRDHRPMRTVHDYGDRKSWDNRTRSWREWTHDEKQAALNRERLGDWSRLMASVIRPLLSEAQEAEKTLQIALQKRQTQHRRLVTAVDWAKNWTTMRVMICHTLSSGARQILVPLFEVSASRAEVRNTDQYKQKESGNDPRTKTSHEERDTGSGIGYRARPRFPARLRLA
jgi:hypothetical protein